MPALSLRALLIEADNKAAAEVLALLRRVQQPACIVRHVPTLTAAGAALGEAEHDIILLGAGRIAQATIALMDRLHVWAPDTPIVVITQSDKDEFSSEMLQHGAQDCFARTTTDERMLRRILRYAIERKHAQQHISWLRNFDSLTGLPNRELLRDRLHQAVAQASGQEQLLSVLMLNLDRFKLVNEILGHRHGDRLLQEVAHRLRGCLTELDTLARYNGDEFIAILPGLMSVQDAAIIAQKMLETLARPIVIEGHEVYVTGSIGISVFPSDGDNGDVLMSNADAALARAKDQGRNHFQFYTLDMNAKTTRRLTLETELRRAVERGEFTLYYQPLFDLRQRRITGFEALVRWQHPEFGLVPPNDFIPLAEEAGLIVPIGEWVLREACAQAKIWRAGGYPDIRMSVNLSSRQFFQENVLDIVTRTLKETELPPDALTLELTESAVMQNPDEATVTLCLLNNMGVRIAIDDFGTGHSSLNHLKRFPIDCLKIDRSFVNDVTVNPDDAAIAQAIIAMGHSLRLQVVAEGVETLEQLRFLESYGCDVIQGYLLSRPLPADQITRTFMPPTGGRAEVLPFGLHIANASPSST